MGPAIPVLRFRSRVDWWFIAASMAAYGICGLVIVSMPVKGLSFSGVLAAVMIAGWSWMLFGTYYTIDNEALIVRHGPITHRVELVAITAVKDSRSRLASPALSLDKIEIVSARGSSLHISPADKAGFVQALRARVPGVVVEGIG